MQPILTPQHFVSSWRNVQLGERQSYQMHFADVCRLVGYETPNATGKNDSGETYTFEHSLKKQSGGQGFADVFLEGHFAIEYKAPGKYADLREAYDQLLQYRETLNNPPLLIVTDIQNWEIHTNWPNTEKRVYRFSHEDIANRSTVQDYLRFIFTAPERLHPRRNTEQVTADAAKAFEVIASNMRGWEAEPERIAHFLTKIVFCLFAEDVSLLPTGPSKEIGIFSEILAQTRHDTSLFVNYTNQLFQAMADGGHVLFQRIPFFNGALFDDVRVEELAYEALTELEKASRLNWESVEPAIFGTLFERSLDPAKRSQLGAHYTSREDILLIVEPVLMRPLERQWEEIKAKATPIRAQFDEAMHTSNRRQQTTLAGHLESLREEMLNRLRSITVLDPACGSGNFLYVALQRLMDMEKEVLFHPLFEGLTRPFPEVHPSQMYGIEKDEIAHALASIVVWIGFLQWRRTNGYLTNPKEPILQDIHENIQNMDAILTYDVEGKPCEPEWPAVDVIIGNPPFLGNKKMRGELGNEYVLDLRKLYENRVSGGSDLVTYWHEKARAQIEHEKAKRSGLLSTQSIRAGANRETLEKIKETGDIFMAWADRAWILDGASVRVSMIGFDNGTENERTLDGVEVSKINSDLTSVVDITKASILSENLYLTYQGTIKGGDFDIELKDAQKMLDAKNASDVSNSDVVHPWINASDIVQRPRHKYIIYFPHGTSEDVAKKYEAPFKHVLDKVVPERTAVHYENYPSWIHVRPRPELQEALKAVTRYIATPRVAKHRIFVWLEKSIVPDSRVYAIVRDDDYFFGMLHSKLHEVWSLAQASRHGVGNDPTYNNTTCFETFPFPFVPGQEDVNSVTHKAIAAAAKQLHEERDAWLNPPNASNAQLKDRTLTNLYNALNVWRGIETMRVKSAAADFAPRLDELHNQLDRAVCDAYGWSYEILNSEDEILGRLLALNLERAGEDETLTKE